MSVRISISDPWELGESLGWQLQAGSVTYIQDEPLLIRFDQPFSHEGRSYRFAVAVPRHEDFGVKTFLQGAEVLCNFICVADDLTKPAEVVSAWRGGHAFIGVMTNSPRSRG